MNCAYQLGQISILGAWVSPRNFQISITNLIISQYFYCPIYEFIGAIKNLKINMYKKHIPIFIKLL